MNLQKKSFSQRAYIVLEIIRLIWNTYPLSFFILISLTLLQAILPLAVAWVTKLIFDLLAFAIKNDTGIPWQELFPLLVFQIALAIVQQTSEPINQFLKNELGRKLTVFVQTEIYKKINSFPGLAYFENPFFYDQIRLAEQGAHNSATHTINNIVYLFQSSITLVSFLGVLLMFQPLLASLLLIAALPQLLIELRHGQYRYSLIADLSPKQRRKFFYSMLLSGHQSIKEVRLFNLGTLFFSRLRALIEEINSAEKLQQKRELSGQVGLNIISSLVNGIAFVLVILAAFAERISFGDIALYNAAIANVQGALDRFLVALAGLNESVLLFTYYDELMQMPPDICPLSPVLSVEPLSTSIELCNVSFRYSENHPWVLENVNLKIEEGESLALVGLNGAGKTTLIKLLTRLYDPTKGNILWNGVDIRHFEIESLRQRIGVIFQDYMKYDLTIQENIGLGSVERINDLDWIKQVADQAGVHELIDSMPNSYQTSLGFTFTDEAGMDLSGGQWQKLALARLFMRGDADFLVLDEPTSALDVQSESETYTRFTELMNGKTTLLISHRFSTVQMADKIAVLENGRITEFGSHKELVTSGGTYSRLFKCQAERYAQ